MPRGKDHYLSKLKNGSFPARVIVFNCTPLPIEKSASAAIVECDLAGWTLQVHDLIDENFMPGETCCGSNAATFWHCMQRLLKSGRVTWALGYGVAFQLSLTGFWELLEDDKWRLTETDWLTGEIPCNSPNLPQSNNQICLHSQSDYSCRQTSRKWTGYCVLQDPPTIVVCRPKGNKSTLKILDIRNYGVMTPETNQDGSVSVNWLGRWLNSFNRSLRSANLGGMQATAASQALHGFRVSYLETSIRVHSHTESLKLERESLYSGRNECARIGRVHGPVYHLDFTSYYPSIAANSVLPCRLVGHSSDSMESVRRLIRSGFQVIARCAVCTTEPRYPVRSCKRTIFPVGTFITTLAPAELELALEMEQVARVYEFSWYETGQPFKRWAETLWNLRNAAIQSGNKAEAETYKRLANSLYGKFGQWSWRWLDFGGVEPPGPFALWYAPRPGNGASTGISPINETDQKFGPQLSPDEFCRWRAIGWAVQYESELDEHRESIPALASALYSIARVKLYDTAINAGLDNVVYMDTDSLWVTHSGYRTLERRGMFDNDGLGALRLVSIYPWVNLWGIKQYELPTGQHHAGVPEHASRIGSWKWQFFSAERMSSALENGTAPRAAMISHVADYKSPYKHGHVMRNGRVNPITLNEDIGNGRSGQIDSLSAIERDIAEYLASEALRDNGPSAGG
jgi:hypothetical protein